MIRCSVCLVDEEAAAEPVKVAADGGQQRPAYDDPRIPWSGKPRRVDIVCWASIMLGGIFYWAILPFRASLVGTHPVLLELLNGSAEAIVAAAAFARVGHGSLIVVLLAAIPGLMKFDPLFWWAGGLWGEGAITLMGGPRNRGARYMARVQRWGRKFTWPAVLVAQFLPIPTAIIYVIAGWAGMRLSRSSSWTPSARCCGRARWPGLATRSAITRSWWPRRSRTTGCGSLSC